MIQFGEQIFRMGSSHQLVFDKSSKDLNNDSVFLLFDENHQDIAKWHRVFSKTSDYK